MYAIEDWGTGYLDDFPDGRKFDPKPSILDPFPCHSHGMVGFVKELVDEQWAGSIALGRKEQFRWSKFESLLITQGRLRNQNGAQPQRDSKSRARG